jgi:hypothetical protein
MFTKSSSTVEQTDCNVTYPAEKLWSEFVVLDSYNTSKEVDFSETADRRIFMGLKNIGRTQRTGRNSNMESTNQIFAV